MAHLIEEGYVLAVVFFFTHEAAFRKKGDFPNVCVFFFKYILFSPRIFTGD